MSVNAAAVVGGYVDTFLWITVRFFLLSTEMSVVIFGLAFGHLDSRSSIRYVLLATSLFSLAFSTSQGALEVLAPDESFRIHSKDFNIFGHGGMLFWFTSSIVFSMIYIIILILPWTRLRERLNLPTKKSFYLYVLFLALLNISQSVGSGLLLYGVREGLCVVDVTTCIYFTFFTPLVYHTFLSEFFGVSQPSIMFSYKAQVDDTMEDDTVSLPHQQSFSSLKTDSDYIYQSNSVYDSTQFDSAIPAPLYNTSLQSPDSITGYSLDSQTIDLPSGKQ
uniref:Transmembrane protein adipocyte-associated 1 homolog n=3 Tax=Proconiini TaxID=565685 RepID=A0A1B6HKA0_9HEMI